MTLSIRNTLRSLSLLALTAAFIPGCDSEEYEALGLSSEEIDAMSEEELDDLAALEDSLEHSVDQKHLSAAEHPGEPDPSQPSDDLVVDPVEGTRAGVSTEGFDAFWHPTHTHAGLDTEGFDTLWKPTHTHAGLDTEGFDTLWKPTHTHAATVDVIGGAIHPTHGLVPNDEIGVSDPGCKPDAYKPVLAANG